MRRADSNCGFIASDSGSSLSASTSNRSPTGTRWPTSRVSRLAHQQIEQDPQPGTGALQRTGDIDDHVQERRRERVGETEVGVGARLAPQRVPLVVGERERRERRCERLGARVVDGLEQPVVSDDGQVRVVERDVGEAPGLEVELVDEARAAPLPERRSR